MNNFYFFIKNLKIKKSIIFFKAAINRFFFFRGPFKDFLQDLKINKVN